MGGRVDLVIIPAAEEVSVLVVNISVPVTGHKIHVAGLHPGRRAGRTNHSAKMFHDEGLRLIADLHCSTRAIARDYLLKEARRLGLMDAPADRPHSPDNDLRG